MRLGSLHHQPLLSFGESELLEEPRRLGLQAVQEKRPDEFGVPEGPVQGRPVAGKTSPVANELRQAFHRAYESAAGGLPVAADRTLIVVPAYKERLGLSQELENIFTSLGDARSSCSVAVVLNGPYDFSSDVVRTWAALHPNEVRLVESADDGPLDDDGRLVVHLLNSQPGKIHALLTAEEAMRREGQAPQYVLQLDADSHLSPGNLEALKEHLAASGSAAVSGRPVFATRTGEAPHIFHQLTNARLAEFGSEGLPGGMVLSRTPDFLAGFKAIEEVAPHCRADDTLYTAVLRLAGRRTSMARHVAYSTDTPTDPAQRHAQVLRWLTGNAQVAQLLGPALDEIGMRGSSAVNLWRGLIASHDLGVSLQRALAVAASTPEMLALLRESAAASRVEPSEQPVYWNPPRDTSTASADLGRIARGLEQLQGSSVSETLGNVVQDAEARIDDAVVQLGLVDLAYGDGGPARQRLADIRQRMRDRLLAGEPFQATQAAFVAEIDALFGDFAARALKEAGPPPCAVSIIGFGSFGRGELKPYSDLDYALVLGDESPAAQRWGKVFAERLDRHIKSLGESRTGRKAGLASCYAFSPTGILREQMIGTPAQLSHAIEALPRFFRPEQLLGNSRTVWGDRALGSQAQVELLEGHRAASTLDGRREQLLAIAAQLPRPDALAARVDLKQFAQGIELALQALSFQWNLSGSSYRARIDEAVRRGLLDQDLARQVQGALDYSAARRCLSDLTGQDSKAFLVTEAERTAWSYHSEAVLQFIDRFCMLAENPRSNPFALSAYPREMTDRRVAA